MHYQLDVNTLYRDETVDALPLNGIDRVTLRTTQPLFCDPYDRNRLNGGFIPVEEGTKVTVGAGMITQTD